MQQEYNGQWTTEGSIALGTIKAIPVVMAHHAKWEKKRMVHNDTWERKEWLPKLPGKKGWVIVLPGKEKALFLEVGIQSFVDSFQETI